MRTLREITNDIDGKAPIKLVFGFCLLATAGAISSPAFEANPLIGSSITKFRNHLPETLDKVTDALR